MKLLRLLTVGLATLAVMGCGSSSGDGDDASGGTGAAGETSSATGGSAATGGSTGSGGAATSTTSTSSSSLTGKLYVNEVVPSNKTGATDEGGSFPDWLELYNSSDEDISLAGLYISDDSATPTKATLDASLTVNAGGVLLLWADGDITQSVLHLPFALSAAAEGIYLFDAQQQLIDSVEWVTAGADQSYARFPDGGATLSWCGMPTPDALNGAACAN